MSIVVQFLSWVHGLFNSMNCSTPGFPVLHHLPELASNSCPLSQRCHPTISSSVILFSSCLQSFPAWGSFPTSWLFTSGGQRIRASALASVPPVNIQDWFPLGVTGLISLQSKGLPRVFLQHHCLKVSILQHSTSFMVPTHTLIHDHWKNHSFDYMDQSLCFFNMLSRFVIAFLPRNKHLLIWWLQSLSEVILEPRKVESVTVSIVSPSVGHEVMGPDAMIFVFWMLSFKPAFSLSSFTFIKRLFSSSSLSTYGWCHLHIWGY